MWVLWRGVGPGETATAVYPVVMTLGPLFNTKTGVGSTVFFKTLLPTAPTLIISMILIRGDNFLVGVEWKFPLADDPVGSEDMRYNLEAYLAFLNRDWMHIDVCGDMPMWVTFGTEEAKRLTGVDVKSGMQPVRNEDILDSNTSLTKTSRDDVYQNSSMSYFAH
uniref:Uncharacterized protein n=1 Tax=Oryza glumipatula TaxID=40148 RepID=A0A0D9ZN36_9ORYZ